MLNEMGSLKQVAVVVVEIWGCIGQKNPRTSFLGISCITTIRKGAVVRRSNSITYWCRELHLKVLPDQGNTRLALRRNRIQQQTLTIKESVRLWRLNIQGSKLKGFDHLFYVTLDDLSLPSSILLIDFNHNKMRVHTLVFLWRVV